MSDTTKKTRKQSKAKTVTFAQLRVMYAKQNEITDVGIASKRLRSKIRGAYGKNDAVTTWMSRNNKENKDGNRYGDATLTEAKAILAL